MAAATIRFELQGTDILVDAISYKNALDAVLGLLREIDGSITRRAGETGHSLRWFVNSTRTSNPMVEILAESTLPGADVASSVVDTTLDALETLQKGPNRPPHLSYVGLERCQDLSELIRRGGLSEITISSGRRDVLVTDRLGANVREVIGQKIEVLGSVEGTLEMITLRGRSYFSVYSVVTGKATRCYFQEQLMENARAALGRRVSVTGRLRSFPQEEGQDMTEITNIEVMPPEGTLPAPEDVRGILPKQNKASEDYLRERWIRKQSLDWHVAVEVRRTERQFPHLDARDAIHVGTAVYLEVEYLHTYDSDILRCDEQLPGMSITHPEPFGTIPMDLDNR